MWCGVVWCSVGLRSVWSIVKLQIKNFYSKWGKNSQIFKISLSRSVCLSLSLSVSFSWDVCVLPFFCVCVLFFGRLKTNKKKKKMPSPYSGGSGGGGGGGGGGNRRGRNVSRELFRAPGDQAQSETKSPSTSSSSATPGWSRWSDKTEAGSFFFFFLVWCGVVWCAPRVMMYHHLGLFFFSLSVIF